MIVGNQTMPLSHVVRSHGSASCMISCLSAVPLLFLYPFAWFPPDILSSCPHPSHLYTVVNGSHRRSQFMIASLLLNRS